MTAPASIDAYVREARSWDADRASQLARAARAGWLVAGAACACALASGIAMALMMPLKRVDPFVVRVDNATGIVDVVPVYSTDAAPGEMVSRYFLSHYVSVCERFNFATAQSDYEECAAFHSTKGNADWYARWARTNPASPLNVHKDGSRVAVNIVSVSFLPHDPRGPELAQVRYVKVAAPGPGGHETSSHWIATLRYTYVAPSADPRIRRWNPLGFRVEDMQSEPEAAEETGTSDATAGLGGGS